MTRKDYNALADAIADYRASFYDTCGPSLAEQIAVSTIDGLAHELAGVCKVDNPRFDRDRFLIACGVPRPKGAYVRP